METALVEWIKALQVETPIRIIFWTIAITLIIKVLVDILGVVFFGSLGNR